jgi:hypothetical protein
LVSHFLNIISKSMIYRNPFPLKSLNLTSLLNLTNDLGSANNLEPSSFLAIDQIGLCRYLELIPFNINCNASSIVFGIWAKEKNSPNRVISLGTVGYSAGENRGLMLNGNGFKAINSNFIEFNSEADKYTFAATVILDSPIISVSYGYTDRKFIVSQPGLSDTTWIKASLSGNFTAPNGISGNLKVTSTSADTIAIDSSHPFVIGDTFEINTNINIISGTYIPPFGISGRINAVDINTSTNSLTVLGSALDFRLLHNQQIRLRSVGTAFNINGSTYNTNTTYFIISATGSVGNQTIQLSVDGSSVAIINNPGIGWNYIFPVNSIRNCILAASNRLSIDGVLVDFQDEINALAGTMTLGTASTITCTNAFSNVTPVAVTLTGATTVPTGALIGKTYFTVPGTVTGTAFQLAASSGGLPLAFTAAGAGCFFNNVTGTVSVGTPATFTTTNSVNHFVTQDQQLTLTNGVVTVNSFAATITVNTVQFCENLRLASNALPVGTGTTGWTLTSSPSRKPITVQRSEVWIKAVSDSEVSIAKTNAGDLITIGNSNGASTFTLAIDSADTKISGSVLLRGV